MRRSIFCWIIVILSSLTVQAQHTIKINGKVIDGERQTAFEHVNVRLFNLKDTTIVRGTITDQQGQYTFKNIQKGLYRLTLSFVGYEHYSDTLTIKGGEDLTLQSIILRPDTKSLKEIDVTKDLPPIVFKKDTVTFNAAAFKVPPGSVVEDLLKRLPGMVIERDGSIKYNGEAIDRLELNGRKFFTKTPHIATQNLPSMIIDKVQVIDKKSEKTEMTGIDDGERTKVLNLQTHKDMNKGWLVNMSGGYGTSDRYEGNTMVSLFDDQKTFAWVGNGNNTNNIESGGDGHHISSGVNVDYTFSPKLDLTSSVTYDYRQQTNWGKRTLKSILAEDQYSTSNSSSSNDMRIHDVNIDLDLTWRPTPKTRIQITPNIRLSKNNMETSSSNGTQNMKGEYMNKTQSLVQNNDQNLNTSITIRGLHRLNDKGRSIYGSFRANYSNGERQGLNRTVTTYEIRSRPDDLLNLRSMTTNNALMAKIDLSYIEPIIEKGVLTLNYKLTTQQDENQTTSRKKGKDDTYSEISKTYSPYSYSLSREHEIGATFSYRQKRNSINIEGKIMPQYTHSRMGYAGDVSDDRSRTVWEYAPSVRLSLSPNDSLDISIYYSGNSRHPEMSMLSPLEEVSSPLMKMRGNPNLKPSFTHLMFMNGTWRAPSKEIYLSLNASVNINQNDMVMKQTTDVKTGQTEMTFENVNGNMSISGNISPTFPLGIKGLTGSLRNAFRYNVYKTYINNQLNTNQQWLPEISPRITYNTPDISINLGSSFTWRKVKNSVATTPDQNTRDLSLNASMGLTLPWSIYFDTDITYIKRTGYAQEYGQENCLWNLSLSKTFLKSRQAILEVKVFDLLNQRSFYNHNISFSGSSESFTNGIKSYGMITFKYQFNSFKSDSSGANRRLQQPHRQQMMPPSSVLRHLNPIPIF